MANFTAARKNKVCDTVSRWGALRKKVSYWFPFNFYAKCLSMKSRSLPRCNSNDYISRFQYAVIKSWPIYQTVYIESTSNIPWWANAPRLWTSLPNEPISRIPSVFHILKSLPNPEKTFTFPLFSISRRSAGPKFIQSITRYAIDHTSNFEEWPNNFSEVNLKSEEMHPERKTSKKYSILNKINGTLVGSKFLNAERRMFLTGVKPAADRIVWLVRGGCGAIMWY